MYFEKLLDSNYLYKVTAIFLEEDQCQDNSDCYEEEACEGGFCVDPCVYVCDNEYVDCFVYNHVPYYKPRRGEETGTEKLGGFQNNVKTVAPRLGGLN